MSQLKVNSIVPVAGLPSGAKGGIIQVKQNIKTDTSSFNASTGNFSGNIAGLTETITTQSSIPICSDEGVHSKSDINNIINKPHTQKYAYIHVALRNCKFKSEINSKYKDLDKFKIKIDSKNNIINKKVFKKFLPKDGSPDGMTLDTNKNPFLEFQNLTSLDLVFIEKQRMDGIKNHNIGNINT